MIYMSSTCTLLGETYALDIYMAVIWEGADYLFISTGPKEYLETSAGSVAIALFEILTNMRQ